MRRPHRIAAVALLAALLCPAAARTPVYTVAHLTEQTPTGYADLLMPDATPTRARHAIADYATRIGDRQQLYFLTVKDPRRHDRYVCRARWYRDATSWRQHAVGPAPSGPWPHLTVICP